MTPRPTPVWLRDVLGERFVPAELLLVLLVAAAVTARVLPEVSPPGLAPWRAALAGLLIADVAAGSVANLTASTTETYASSSVARWRFIAVHVHILGIAALVDGPFGAAVQVWGWTIAVAALVNAQLGRPSALSSLARAWRRSPWARRPSASVRRGR